VRDRSKPFTCFVMLNLFQHPCLEVYPELRGMDPEPKTSEAKQVQGDVRGVAMMQRTYAAIKVRAGMSPSSSSLKSIA
jgi:hypothetical protein